MAYIDGIDISIYQVINSWQAIRDAGVRFAYVKATEGLTWTDKTFVAKWNGAKSVGILRGAYHFFHPNMDPVKQADNFIRTVKPHMQSDDLPPMFDLEVSDNTANKISIARAHVWLKQVEQALGKRPIIYSRYYFLRDNFSVNGQPPEWANDYILWLAAYDVASPSLPPGWKSWKFWQYTEKGKVNGIQGNVDRNYFNGTEAELYALAGAKKPADSPATPPAGEEEGAAPAPTQHTVLAGETLDGIAAKYGLTLDALLKANEDLFKPGTVLKLPAASKPATPPVEPQMDTYIVKSGDSLWVIAQKYGVSMDEIAKANNLPNKNQIFVGQVLVIPKKQQSFLGRLFSRPD